VGAAGAASAGAGQVPAARDRLGGPPRRRLGKRSTGKSDGKSDGKTDGEPEADRDLRAITDI
jgi:hypothetical protein